MSINKDLVNYPKDLKLHDHYLCPVCRDPIYKPVEHNGGEKTCRRMFCHGCLQIEKKCPICKLEVGHMDVTVVSLRHITSELNEIKVTCKMCEKEFEIKDLAEHQELCNDTPDRELILVLNKN